MTRNTARLEIKGLAEMRAEFQQLPAALRDDTKPLALRAGETAYTAVYASLPFRTGLLRAGLQVKVEQPGSAYGVKTKLVNTAPHAHLIEDGTHTLRPAHVFRPAVIRARREMWEHIVALVQGKGLTVRGSIDDDAGLVSY